MKSQRLFWIATVAVVGALIALGFYFAKTNVTLFLITEVFALLLCVLFAWLYIMLIKPFKVISEGIDLLKAQDFSSYLREVNNAEANKAVKLFNHMMTQLKDERLHVREQNHFLDLLINASPLGFIILDFDEHISQINPAATKLLNIKNVESVIGKKLNKAGISLGNSLALLKEEESIVLRLSGITMYRCSRSSFIDRGFPHPYILIEELTHELLKVEKKSYESVIRMLAHEVNNSVAAVSSTLNIISDSLKDEAGSDLSDVLPAVDASLNRCIHLSRFISNFAEVVKIPLPSISNISINELVHGIEDIFVHEFQRQNIKLSLDLTEPSVIEADNIQLEQVLINIIKNACEAIGNNGEIKITATGSPFTICIDNNGEEISKKTEEKLFTPFFTTKTTGQGIGLMFVREVLINHGYQFSLSTLPSGWTRFEIVID